MEVTGQRTPRGVLFLCVANSARSQIAEGWARKLVPPGMRIWSAGSQPAPAVNPYAVRVMQEVGIDISSQQPKRISDVPLGDVDTVITLCAEEICVLPPSGLIRLNWALPDPAAATGSEQEIEAAFRKIRDELREKIQMLANVAPAQS
jgi:arsenate reductase